MTAEMITPSTSPVLTVIEGADMMDTVPIPPVNPLSLDPNYFPVYSGGKIKYEYRPPGATREIRALTMEDYLKNIKN